MKKVTFKEKGGFLFFLGKLMVFSQLSFVFFFLPFFLALDKILKGGLRNWLLILSSLLFYLWGEGKGVFLLITLCLLNLIVGKMVTPPPFRY